jgi:hypothetical protein
MKLPHLLIFVFLSIITEYDIRSGVVLSVSTYKCFSFVFSYFVAYSCFSLPNEIFLIGAILFSQNLNNHYLNRMYTYCQHFLSHTYIEVGSAYNACKDVSEYHSEQIQACMYFFVSKHNKTSNLCVTVTLRGFRVTVVPVKKH